MYLAEFEDKWDKYFESLAPDVQRKVWKKINQIKEGLPGRHLKHGLDYFVEEVGQFRICYKSFKDRKVRRFYFVGDHKEYDKWCRNPD